MGGEPVHGDYALQPGDVIRIANCQMAYVHDLAKAFTDSGTKLHLAGALGDETVSGPYVADTSDSHVLDVPEPTRITHRRGQTKFLTAHPKAAGSPRLGQAAAQLCRLAFQMAHQTDVPSLAKLALDGLFEGTQADAGGVLLGPRESAGDIAVAELELVATRCDRPVELSSRVDVPGQHGAPRGRGGAGPQCGKRQQPGHPRQPGRHRVDQRDLRPIRQDERVIGLVHLYSTDAERMLDPDDLEFTLAVADNLALALKNLDRQQELAENLSQSQNEIVQLRRRLGAESEIVGNGPLMQKLQQAIAAGGAQPGHRADPRRKRRGQGTGGAGHPLRQPAQKGPSSA